MMGARMRIVVLGLSLSSSWGNGHATTYRALLGALADRGHDILFLERDVPWYAANRDLEAMPGVALALYPDLAGLAAWTPVIRDADLVVVGSYVPDGVAVCRLALTTARGLTAFYDIDTPVTAAALDAGTCAYLAPGQVAGFDLYLSFTGGPMLEVLERRHGARMARALYCSVDAALYRPLPIVPRFDLGYLGTWAADRQPVVEALLIEPARRLPHRRFVVAGAQYPASIDWPRNVERIEHVPPAGHAAFYAACRTTLNATRADMRRAGWSPSVRLFEAAACGTAIVSDPWPGLASLLEPGREIAVAERTCDVVALIENRPEAAIRAMAAAARARILAAHTSGHRAVELERAVAEAASRRRGATRRRPVVLAADPACNQPRPAGVPDPSSERFAPPRPARPGVP